MDHEGLAERIDKDKPEDSYAIKKALTIEEHKGGKRFEPGSWEHHIFLAWIKAGAQPVAEPKTLVKLEVTPSELLYSDKGQTTQLRAVAVWNNGTSEDVTCLTRFQTNDPQVCDISQGDWSLRTSRGYPRRGVLRQWSRPRSGYPSGLAELWRQVSSGRDQDPRR